MKKYFFTLFATVSFFVSMAQNIQVECAYLQAIKNQNPEIIKDNIRNAELTAQEIVAAADSFQKNGSRFFTALSENYLAVGQAEAALFSLIRQRCVFPDAEIEVQTSDLWQKSCFRAKILKSVSDSLWLSTQPNEIKKLNLEKRIARLLEKTLKIEQLFVIDQLIGEYYKLYLKQNQKKIPYILNQYQFYTNLNLSAERKFLYLKINSNNELFVPESLSFFRRKCLVRRALRFYKKTTDSAIISAYKNIK